MHILVVFHNLLNHILCIILSLLLILKPSSCARYGCPARPLIKPCVCQEISKGLDVSCEGSRLDQLREALENFGQTGQAIWYLKMRKNHMVTFPSFLLDGLDIRHLVAHHCNITSLDDSSFAGLSNLLESIDLSQNGLHEVPSKALETLTSLISLNLNYNLIESLKAHSFKGLISLLRLSLYGNKIKTIDLMAFNGVGGNLTRINLGGNLLDAIPSKSLQNLTTLQTLQVRENKISSISTNEFDGIAAANCLDILNIASNFIEELRENSFLNFHALNSLDLEANYISKIHIYAFKGIEESLEWLTLAENRLQEIPSSSLQNLTRLRQLDLRGNNISVIHENALKEFGNNLKFIYLQKNNIYYIENGALDTLLSLEWLYIHSNKLSTISVDIFSTLLNSKSLAVLDAHNNPFVCDCRIAWFREWIQNGKGAKVVNLPKETKCNSPEQLKKVAISEIPYAYLSCGKSASIQQFYYFTIFTNILHSIYLYTIISIIICKPFFF